MRISDWSSDVCSSDLESRTERMTLEEYVAELNSLAFWREFTFAETKFAPRPGQELELADNIVWLGDFAFILQLKEREGGTRYPAAERAWFRNKVLRKEIGRESCREGVCQDGTISGGAG